MPCEALAHGPTRLRKDPSHHEPGHRFVGGAPFDGETEEKIDRTQRTRGRPGAVEDLFRKPQGLKKGAESFEILELTREALVVEPLGLQVRGYHDREGKMLHATPHVPIFGMGELAQDGHGYGPLRHPLDKG